MTYSQVPEDLLPLIFEELTTQRDWHACSLVSSVFNRAVTPILYRSWDTRVILDLPARSHRLARLPKIFHPVKTFLAKKELLQYVKHARGTATIHIHGTELFEETLTALQLCSNLQSFTWTDDHADRMTRQPHTDPIPYDVADQSLRRIIHVLRGLPIKELTIRTYSGLSEEAWTEMKKLTGLTTLALWCQEGQPRILQGWSESLANTLTHLSLGRCQGVPATVLLNILSQLPLLQSLGIKGAASSAIPEILTFLPHLKSLDIDYMSGSKGMPVEEPIVARLERLIVRTNDLSGHHNIWSWIRNLTPYPSLESFKLNTFSVQGDATIPRTFILALSQIHERVLKQFHVTGAGMALPDIQCLCAMFPKLEDLTWSVMFSADIAEMGDAIVSAKNLRTLRVEDSFSSTALRYPMRVKFDITDAKELMLREGSQLRNICVPGASYKGKWMPVVQEDGSTGVDFEVVRDGTENNWLQ